MNVKQWYVYKNDLCIIGPTHFMGAVANVNRLCILGYPGNAAFQAQKSFRNGVSGDMYELSTLRPEERNATAKTYSTPIPAKPKLSIGHNVVGVKFSDEAHRVNVAMTYHFNTDLHFNPGDKAVVLGRDGNFKVVTIVAVSNDPSINPTSWIVDKVDLTRHNFRTSQQETEKKKQARATEIRHLLDEKLAATNALQKYTGLGDPVSAALVEELRKLTN